MCKCTVLQCTGCCTVYHPAALQVGNQCLQKCIVQMCTLCVFITGFDSCAEQFAPIQSDFLVIDRLKEFLAVSFLFCFLHLLIATMHFLRMLHSFLVWLTSAASRRGIITAHRLQSSVVAAFVTKIRQDTSVPVKLCKSQIFILAQYLISLVNFHIKINYASQQLCFLQKGVSIFDTLPLASQQFMLSEIKAARF